MGYVPSCLPAEGCLCAAHALFKVNGFQVLLFDHLIFSEAVDVVIKYIFPYKYSLFL